MKAMKILFFTLLSLLFLLPDCLMASAHHPVRKPSPPLAVSIKTSGEIMPGATLDILVTVTSMTAAGEMRADIKLLGRIELISGELSWRGPVNKGDVIGIPLSVRVPQNGRGRVKALAFIDQPGAARFSVSESLKLSPEKDRDLSPPDLKRDGKGRDIIEYRP